MFSYDRMCSLPCSVIVNDMAEVNVDAALIQGAGLSITASQVFLLQHCRAT